MSVIEPKATNGITRCLNKKLHGDEILRLYDRHGPALVAYAGSFVANVAVAEDVVHQVFVKLLQGSVGMPHAPAAYLYRAVRNGALNALRDGFREVAADPNNLLFTHPRENRETVLTLQATLAELPEQQREVVIMKIWSGMTLEEIAATTEVSPNTTASRYRYALMKLRERLKPFGKGR